jgi:hypothetical protein
VGTNKADKINDAIVLSHSLLLVDFLRGRLTALWRHKIFGVLTALASSCAHSHCCYVVQSASGFNNRAALPLF